jgi:hypothetical protein
MSAIGLFDLLACILSLVAAVFIFDQHLTRPRPYKLLWTFGLLFYSIGAGAVVAGDVGHWSPLDLKLWYLCGAVLTPPYLGLGSLWLLAPRRISRWVVGAAVVVTLYAIVRMLLLPISADAAAHLATLSTSAVTSTGFQPLIPVDMVVVTVLMSVAGTVFLVGGALWSAWTYYRRHAPGYRLVSMVLLALGGLFPAILTGLQRFGYSGGAALGEFLGAGLILAGLLISLDVFTVFRIPFTHVVLRERRPAPVAYPSQAQ